MTAPHQLELLDDGTSRLFGLRVRLPDGCRRCDSTIAVIGRGAGPHFGELKCEAHDHHCVAKQVHGRLDCHHRQQDRRARRADRAATEVMMAAILDQPTAQRLAKLCGMLGSAHAGERAAAAAKADRLVRSLNLTWHELIVAPSIAPSETLDTPPWRQMAEFCHAREARLRLRELEFIESILRWHRDELTEKQSAWLGDIYARLHNEAGR